MILDLSWVVELNLFLGPVGRIDRAEAMEFKIPDPRNVIQRPPQSRKSASWGARFPEKAERILQLLGPLQ
jgi:hypothetical protein